MGCLSTSRSRVVAGQGTDIPGMHLRRTPGDSCGYRRKRCRTHIIQICLRTGRTLRGRRRTTPVRIESVGWTRPVITVNSWRMVRASDPLKQDRLQLLRQAGAVIAAPDRGLPTACAARKLTAAPRGELVRVRALARRSTAAAARGRASRRWPSATSATAPRARWRSARSQRKSGPSRRGSVRVPRREANRGHLVRPALASGSGRSW
jgi:hypothetical protein